MNQGLIPGKIQLHIEEWAQPTVGQVLAWMKKEVFFMQAWAVLPMISMVAID